MKNATIRKAAILGAGVMGAQIAAHFTAAGVQVLLFDLANDDPAKGDANALPKAALANLRKLEPSPLASADVLEAITPANFRYDLPRLRDCDLVVEAIAEKMELKASFYQQISPHLNPAGIFATNTSGLSVNALAQNLPAALRSRFCGVHFFNPPRYMPLVELIPAVESQPELLDQLETWLTTTLGKTVVRALDTPNFIGNRVGIFALLAVMHHGQRLGLAPDVVDALTGLRIDRAKSATYRTCDVVGLDTMTFAVNTFASQLSDDPWSRYYVLPSWLQALVKNGQLGQKTRGGVYRKEGRSITVIDPGSGNYRPVDDKVAPEVDTILAIKDPGERLAALRASSHPQAEFLWSQFRDLFHYCAVHLGTIAQSAREVDEAMRCGFAWSAGPFELWQAAGWQAVWLAVEADINAGKAMATTPLPAWVKQVNAVHQDNGSFSAAQNKVVPRSSLAVYQRQLFPTRLIGESGVSPGKTLWENDGVRLWQHTLAPRVGILSFKTKKNTVTCDVLAGMLEAVARAEKDCDALVLWNTPPFSLGANLREMQSMSAAQRWPEIENLVHVFQQASLSLKHARVPTVAAVQGMALGGGCEFLLHVHHRVMALEAVVGLVEAGIGLVPAGGGCKELALQASDWAQAGGGNDSLPFLTKVWGQVAKAEVAKSAFFARAMGYAKASDDIVFNADECLYVALQRAQAMALAGQAPPRRNRKLVVPGRNGIASLEYTLVNMQVGGFISAHEYRVAKAIATILCGGEVSPGTTVDENWLLELECHFFVDLLKAKSGKPSRTQET